MGKKSLSHLLITTFILVLCGSSVVVCQLERLVSGTPVGSAFAANFQGSSAIGTASTNYSDGNTYLLIGVLISRTTLLVASSHIGPPFLQPEPLQFQNVYIGDQNYPPSPLFNGQTFAVNASNQVNDTASGTTKINFGQIGTFSRASAALLNPSTSSPPPVGSVCVAYGFSSPTNTTADNSTLSLNYLTAVITDNATCITLYSTAPTDGSVFCAYINSTLNTSSACIPDISPVVFCKQWLRTKTNEEVFAEISDLPPTNVKPPPLTPELRLCLFDPLGPGCRLLCSWFPIFCAPLPLEDKWYAAGIGKEFRSGCNDTVAIPYLFNYIPRLTY